MSEMILSTPDVKRTLHDYDIVFVSGMMLPITLDLNAGDTVDFSAEAIVFFLSPKPSLNSPDTLLPAEDITVLKAHVVSIQHRVREVMELTPDQKFEWGKTFAKASSMVN